HLDQEVDLVKVTAGDFVLLEKEIGRVVERVRDVIGQLNRQREEILRAEQLAAVGQLAASVAHEVRNPLTGIKMIIDVARQHEGEPKLTGEDFEVIHREIERIERKVQGLLDFARPPAARRQSADLCEVVRYALRLIETRLRQQGVRGDFRLPEGP